jgi:uncharacterized protein YjbI with pentapeptide repeats
LRGEDYSYRKLMQFGTIGSCLEKCKFDGAQIDCAQFGAGREMSEFIDCSFDGARMEMGPGGCARFVRCSFRDVSLHNWMCFEVELIDCVFSGRLRRGIFNGTVRAEKRVFLGREHNEFHGNDFSNMDLIDVTFRTGIDLTQQRLPSGSEYLYLTDAAAAVERAKSGLIGWQGDQELRRVALVIVDGLQKSVERGQRQMLLRADDYYGESVLPRESVHRVFSLLRGKSE